MKKRLFCGAFVMPLLVVSAAPAGLLPPDVYWNQDNEVVVVDGGMEAQDKFGAKVASGDFNGDGFDDLVVSTPGENSSAGMVHVFYGSSTGVKVVEAEIDERTFTQSDFGDDEVASDSFGTAIAVGDFNGDGYSDLAIGAPNEDIGISSPIMNAGVVHVVYGSVIGLDPLSIATPPATYSQDSAGVEDTAETSDQFGYSLAAGNFNPDAYDDLVIGMPYESFGATGNQGAVAVFFGSAQGITTTGDQFWSQVRAGYPFDLGNNAEEGDNFGWAFAVGDFGGDDNDDLAISAPHEDKSVILLGTGIVHLLFGSPIGLTEDANEWWIPGWPAPANTNGEDRFGLALAAGDFDADGDDDLAIGKPGTDFTGALRAGSVVVLKSNGSGLQAAEYQEWTQNSAGVDDNREAQDGFGTNLASGRFDSDAADDLAIYVKEGIEGSPTIFVAGAVHVLYGASGAGLATTGTQFLTQDVPGVNDQCENFDAFGSTLGTGDFNNDGRYELVVGTPDESSLAGDTGLAASGLIQIFVNPQIFNDGFETGDHGNWGLGGDK